MKLRLLKDLRNDGTDARRNDIWRIIIFSLVEVTSLAIIHIMGYWIYFTQNVLGLGVSLGLVVMPMVLLDAVTDPILASFFDRFESKYGKFKPLMVIGAILTILPGLVIFMYPVQTSLPQWLDFTILTFMYIIIVIGTTLLKTTSRAGQAIITQDPRQRPLYAMGKTVFEGIVMIVVTLIITSNLFGSMQDPKVWRISIIIISIIAALCITAGMKAISNRDNPLYYKVGNKGKKIKLTEFFIIIKQSKPLRRLLVATASDAFAASIRAGLTIYLFANIILQRSVFSIFDIGSSIVLGLPILFLGVRFATKLGTAKTYTTVAFYQTILGVAGFVACVFLLPADPTYVFSGININMVIVLLIFGLYISTLGISSSLISALAADLTDYEYVQSGKFLPAVIGAVITTVGKISTSAKGLVIVAVMLFSGFGGNGADAIVPENQFINYKFYYAIVIAVFILPALGHFITVLAMKKYPVDDQAMQEVSQILLKDRGLSKDENADIIPEEHNN